MKEIAKRMCLLTLLWSVWQSFVELQQSMYENTKREKDTHQHGSGVAMEKVYELAVCHFGHQIIHHIRHGVVYPMINNAGDDAAAAIIHPTEQYSDECGVHALQQVAVYGSEE